MSHDNSHFSNDESEEDWLEDSKRRMQSQGSETQKPKTMKSGLSVDLKRTISLPLQSNSLVFDLDETPLIPANEVKACSILNPNCDSCQ